MIAWSSPVLRAVSVSASRTPPACETTARPPPSTRTRGWPVLSGQFGVYAPVGTGESAAEDGRLGCGPRPGPLQPYSPVRSRTAPPTALGGEPVGVQHGAVAPYDGDAVGELFGLDDSQCGEQILRARVVVLPRYVPALAVGGFGEEAVHDPELAQGFGGGHCHHLDPVAGGPVGEGGGAKVVGVGERGLHHDVKRRARTWASTAVCQRRCRGGPGLRPCGHRRPGGPGSGGGPACTGPGRPARRRRDGQGLPAQGQRLRLPGDDGHHRPRL